MFTYARLKLTFWYLLIIMCVSLLFSTVIYRVLMQEVSRFEKAQRFRFELRLQEGNFFDKPIKILPHHLPINSELIEETKSRIISMLLIVNSMIFLVSGVLGYWLAGKTLRPIKEMFDEQNRFISDASHEFRTPLASLKIAFEVFLRNKKPGSTEARTIISESLAEVNKLQSLSESLLELASYQKPNGQLLMEKLALKDVIEQAIKKVRPVAREKNISLKSTSLNLQIKGNKTSLTDLFVIILDNAVKYSSNKSEVKIVMKKNDGFVDISITDQGIGIKKKDLPHIFDRFYRADLARSKTNVDGYGLGLSIAKKIVEEHGGKINVKSTPGKGTTFIIRLPKNQRSKLTPGLFNSNSDQ